MLQRIWLQKYRRIVLQSDRVNIRKLVEKYFLREAVAEKVLRFHHEVALRCVVPHMRDAASDVPHHSDNGWKLDDPVYLPPLLAEADVVCPEFAAMLKKILHELQWSPTGDNGALSGTSLLELCVLPIRAMVFCNRFFAAANGDW